MNYTTMKCLQRATEDAISSYGSGEDVKTYQADTDENGHYIKCPDGTKMRLNGTHISFERPNGTVQSTSIEKVEAFYKAAFYLIHKMQEDGTVGDLGPAPTGHKKSNMHSLCAHDIDEENNWDDGW